MASPNLQSAQNILKWSTLALGFLTGIIAVGTFKIQPDTTQARLVKQKDEVKWDVITEEQIMSGAVIQPDTNTIIHLPENFDSISRETLFGQKGKTTRYWGYCFPANDEEAVVAKRTGFPGLLFLSEKERAMRTKEQAARKPKFSISNPPTDYQINAAQNPHTSIRHQVEVFLPATMCYVMTEAPLAIGIDPDNDRLNDKLETEIGTDPHIPDTDGDGILDGVEYASGLNPKVRDSDTDGIIDGIEDADFDGRIDNGETDPRTRDTDHDGLCDGMCRVRLKRTYVYMGEDQNLDGKVDSNETNPLLRDTDGDGEEDLAEVLKCFAAGNTECP